MLGRLGTVIARGLTFKDGWSYREMSTERTGITMALERNFQSRERNICAATQRISEPTAAQLEQERQRWEARRKQEERVNRTIGLAAFAEEFLLRHSATVSVAEAWAVAELTYDFLEKKIAEVVETRTEEIAQAFPTPF